MKDLFDIIQAVLFVILIASLWVAIPIIGIILGSFSAILIIYFIIKEHRENQD